MVPAEQVACCSRHVDCYSLISCELELAKLLSAEDHDTTKASPSTIIIDCRNEAAFHDAHIRGSYHYSTLPPLFYERLFEGLQLEKR